MTVIRPLPYFLKLYFPARKSAPGLSRRKVVQEMEKVLLLLWKVSLKTALLLYKLPYLTGLIFATTAAWADIASPTPSHSPFCRGPEKSPAPWRQQVRRDKELRGLNKPPVFQSQLGRGNSSEVQRQACTLCLAGKVLGSCQENLTPTLVP